VSLFKFAVLMSHIVMKNVFSHILFTLSLVFSLSCLAQESTWYGNTPSNQGKQTDGKVVVYKDARIDKLVEFKGTTVPPAFGPQTTGYRVQLFFDQDKDKVNEARTRFLAMHRNIDTYVEYYAPNYNLLIGNFRTRLEAEKWRAQLSGSFPEGIVKEMRIYLPKLEE
jgi:hypothetical protein